MITKFPKRFKELREDLGLGQDALGRAIDISKGTISLWENGLRDPKLSNLIRLAKFFDVTLDYLVGLED